MKLLILTQKVDINDDLLGFFHNWLEKLAEKVEQISVIALYVGKYDLPKNVKVYSLGKDQYLLYPHIIRRLISFFRFYKYIWQLRKDYDCVFVHMNIEYIFSGALLWRLMRKKIVLWYAHYRVDWRVKSAFLLSHQIVTSTANACKIKSPKLKVVGQGIDVNRFKNSRPEGARLAPQFCGAAKFHILFLGRISKIKNLDLLIKAFERLIKKYNNLFLDIVGSPTPADNDYFKYIQNLISDFGISGKIKFWGRLANFQTIEFYNQADLYVNLTRTGSFDKTSLEAMACETPTLVCNKAFYEYFDENLQKKMIFEESNESDLIQKIENFLDLPDEEKKQIGVKQRETVKKYHSLDNLINNLLNIFNNAS